MKTIVKVKPEKGGLELHEVPVKKPDGDEVVIKIHAASICGSDQHIFVWNTWAQNLYKDILPMPMGHEFCGTVIETGANVRNIKVGDRVCAETHIACGYCDKCRQGMGHICDHLLLFSKSKAGCFSEYTTVTEKCLVKIPDELSNIQGALMEPFGVSVRAVDAAQTAGKSILIQGCGPLGLMAVQVARAMGATRIFATDLDPYRLQFAKDLGADHVIDPANGDITEQILDLTGGIGVRSICEITGAIPAIQKGFSYIAKGGRYIFTGLPSQKLELDIVRDVINREVLLKGCYGREIPKTWNLAFELLSSGRVDLTKITTHQFPLEAFEEAFRVAESRKCGKIIFNCEQ